MPLTGAETRVKDHEYTNWLRVGLALSYLKVGLYSFIQGEVDAMHQSLLQKLCYGSTLPALQCSSCKSQDVKQNRNLYTWKFRSPCPLSVCDTWLTELLAFHNNPTSSKLYWKNCEVTAWPRSPWECAKLYMPQGQSPTNTGPAQSDSQALLTLMASCKYFHSKLSPGGLQLTRMVSTIRNRVMHSVDMRLSDGDRKSFIQDIINLLEDPFHLKSLEECKQAVAEINKINNESLDVSFNIDFEMQALRECVNDCRQELGVHKEETEKTVDFLKETEKIVDSLKEEFKDLKVQLDNFEKETKDRVGDLDTSVNKLSRTVENVKGEVKTIYEEIQLIKGNTMQAIKTADQVSEENIESGKTRSLMQPTEKDVRDIQLLLIKAYESVQIISVNPVFDTAVYWKDLEDFYTDVVIEKEREETAQKRKHEQQVNKENVTSFKQIFEQRDKKVTRIILKALAGQGKSTFCRKLVHTWCFVQKRKLNLLIDAGICDKWEANGLKDKDEMLRFDVLLYICLRDISDEKTLMDVIYTQFPLHESQNLSHKSHIEALIGQSEKNNVLLILDGLDEMDNSSSFTEKIIKKSLYPHLTVLATTRPWKIDQLSIIRSAHIDLLLDLQGFSFENSMLFAKRIFDKYYKDESAIAWFKQDIEKNCVIRSLINVPLLLLFIVHVWYERKSFPQTIHELYMEILNVMVNRYMEGKERKQKSKGRQDDKKYVLPKTWPLENTTFILTPTLKNLSLVQHFGEEFLAALCEVANHLLLTDVKETSLVFEEKVLMELLGKDGSSKLQTALDLGILSNSELPGIFRKKMCLTFLHTTVQEFLAAINMCCREGKCNIFIDSLNTLDDVFKNEKIIMFVAGISTGHCQKISEKMYEVCDKDMNQNRAMIRRKYHMHYLCRLYRDCIRETCREPISLKLHHLYADNQEDWNVLQSALRSTSNVRLLLLSKCTQLKYLDLGHCSLDDYTLDLSESNSLTELSLTNVTMKGKLLLSKCTQIKCLKLVCCSLDDTTLDLSESNCLIELSLKHVTMKGELLLSKCTRLECLELAYCSLDDTTSDLSESNCLTEYSLKVVTMKAKLMLSKLAQLKCMKLVCCRLDDATLDLSESNCLTELSLKDVTMKGKLLLSKCTQLECMKLVCCTLDDATLDLLESNCLTELSLKHVTIKGKLLVSKCTQLKCLELAHCSLLDTTLDLSDSNCLSKLSLELVTMKGKLLVSKCTQLRCLELAYCDLHDATLDLSESNCLTNLSLELVTMKGKLLLSKCTQLKCLELAYCDLHDATLDLSESNCLSELSLKHVTMMGKLLLSKCTQLKCLELTQCDLDEATLDLSESNCLTKLSLEDVPMKSKLLPPKWTRLKHLELAHCGFDDATLDLSESNYLSKLSLEDVKVKLMISKCTQLKCLELAHCILDDAMMDLSESNSLTELILKHVTMKGELLLSKCTQLNCLKLAHCNLDNATLDLSESNCLSELSLKHVTMMGKLLLSKCTRLKCLKLAHCNLDNSTLDFSESNCLTELSFEDVTMKGELLPSKCTQLKKSETGLL